MQEYKKKKIKNKRTDKFKSKKYEVVNKDGSDRDSTQAK